MKYPLNSRPRFNLWRSVLIVAAVGALALNVATRYCDADFAAHAAQAVTTHALDAKRQHLLNDGLHWIAPEVTFEIRPVRVSSVPLPAVRPLARFRPETWLYNRPPPSCRIFS